MPKKNSGDAGNKEGGLPLRQDSQSTVNHDSDLSSSGAIHGPEKDIDVRSDDPNDWGFDRRHG